MGGSRVNAAARSCSKQPCRMSSMNPIRECMHLRQASQALSRRESDFFHSIHVRQCKEGYALRCRLSGSASSLTSRCATFQVATETEHCTFFLPCGISKQLAICCIRSRMGSCRRFSACWPEKFSPANKGSESSCQHESDPR